MPHIDEGTLHALLDGALRAMEPGRADAVEAHLETCADCRALADEAAALRGRAAGILGVLEPAVRPDFEEVLVRAGAGAAGVAAAGAAAGGAAAGGVAGGPGRGDDPRLAARLRWTRRLAWAATVVVAVGMGYLIRDRLGPELGPGGASDAAVDGAGEVARPSEEAAPPVTGPATQVLEQTGPPTAPDEARPERSLAGGIEPSPQANVRGEETDEAHVAAPDMMVTGSAVSSRDPIRLARTDSLGLAGAGAGADAPRRERVVPQADAQAGQAFADAGERAAIRLRDVSGDADAAATAYETVAPEDVFDAIGAPLMVLPGAEVVWAQVGRRGENERIVVSLQRLGGGVEIRVTQEPEQIALEAIVVMSSAAAEPRAIEREPRREARAPAVAPAPPPPAPGRPESAAAAAPERPDSGAAAPERPGAGAAAPLGRTLPDDDLPPGHSRVSASANWLGWKLVLEGPLPEETLRALAGRVAPYGGWPGR